MQGRCVLRTKPLAMLNTGRSPCYKTTLVHSRVCAVDELYGQSLYE
ncbi:MAG TPA: hypothetical protein IGS51_06640 [Thermoleptolyngbya sp. M55_K2018_002]|nr:hypothetical protein [Thermoleptolyngbya sp. M55_K2018_002]